MSTNDSFFNPRIVAFIRNQRNIKVQLSIKCLTIRFAIAINKIKLKDSLKKLEEIVKWFEEQKEADVEVGLEKVKEGAALIKESRKQLGKLENEFEKVKADIEEENDIDYPVEGDEEDGKSDPKDIPF